MKGTVDDDIWALNCVTAMDTSGDVPGDYVTLVQDRHKLVHTFRYATVEPPRPKKRGIKYFHTACGQKVSYGEFRRLGPRSRRLFYTCVSCAR